MFKKQKLALAQDIAPSENVTADALADATSADGVRHSDAPSRFTAAIFPRLRMVAIVEAMVFMAAVVAFNFIAGDGTRYMHVSLHPFWIVVLLISVQYGPAEGLVTSLLASAFLLVGNIPEQSLSETMYDYILHITLLPFLWIVTALVIGFIRGRQINDRNTLFEQLSKATEASAAIVDSYKSIKLSKERLELRLAEERRSILTVYEIAKTLETLDPVAAIKGIEQLVHVALNPKKFSLYSYKNDSMTLLLSHGWEKEDEFARSYDAQHSLVKEAQQKHILSVTRKDEEVLLAGQGMLAGPIFDEQTGTVIGMLKIEEIGFTDIGVRSRETFRIVCAWIAKVTMNVEAHQKAVALTTAETLAKVADAAVTASAPVVTTTITEAKVKKTKRSKRVSKKLLAG